MLVATEEMINGKFVFWNNVISAWSSENSNILAKVSGPFRPTYIQKAEVSENPDPGGLVLVSNYFLKDERKSLCWKLKRQACKAPLLDESWNRDGMPTTERAFLLNLFKWPLNHKLLQDKCRKILEKILKQKLDANLRKFDKLFQSSLYALGSLVNK